MDLTDDSFRALARSSPWRWRSLHLTHRSDTVGVEAWVTRPGHLRVRRADGSEVVETGLPYTSVTVSVGTDAPPPAAQLPHEVSPPLRPDGLVADRPARVDYDDPMYGDYRWVAMLDPVELSHHVALSDLRATSRHGRPTWWAQIRALEGYDARCACCALVWSEHSDRELRSEDWVADPDDYPSAFDVGLDVATAVVVSLRPVDGPGTDPGFAVEIHEAG